MLIDIATNRHLFRIPF